jgi:hypothetical protein
LKDRDFEVSLPSCDELGEAGLEVAYIGGSRAESEDWGEADACDSGGGVGACDFMGDDAGAAADVKSDGD